MKIGDDCVTIAFDRLPNFFWQIGCCRRAIEENAAGVANQAVRPRHYDTAAQNSNGGIEPRPGKEFPRNQSADGSDGSECVRKHVQIRSAQIEIVMMMSILLSMMGAGVRMCTLLSVRENERAGQIHE